MPDIAYSGSRRGSDRWVVRAILVVLIAGVALGLAYRDRLAALFRPTEAPAARPGTVDVFVAAARIPAYARIQPTMLRRVSKARSAVEGRDLLTELQDILYRVPVVDIEPEAPFKEEFLAPKGTRPGLSSGIPPGWAAVTLTEEEADGQVTNLQPGDDVAVLAVWSSKEMPSLAPARSTWISRRARVLVPLRDRLINSTPQPSLMGRPAGRGQKVVHELTLAMPQDDLAAFARAQGRARIQLILLSAIDRDERAVRAPKTLEGEHPVWSVEVIQGTQRSVVMPTWWRPGEESHERKD